MSRTACPWVGSFFAQMNNDLVLLQERDSEGSWFPLGYSPLRKDGGIVAFGHQVFVKRGICSTFRAITSLGFGTASG